MVNEIAGEVSVSEMLSLAESDPQLSEIFSLKYKIEDLDMKINGLKFKIAKYFNKLIDDFALSNADKLSEESIDSLSLFDEIYCVDVCSSLLKFREYVLETSKKGKGDAKIRAAY